MQWEPWLKSHSSTAQPRCLFFFFFPFLLTILAGLRNSKRLEIYYVGSSQKNEAVFPSQHAPLCQLLVAFFGK
ncbi:hypothetical protein LZ32DRAFT_387695 [Colletotrichum eremochloae]|nr:hypothetical protein LZ32DRAFT_387695 [Colletotrichum eremochloae]